MHIRVRTYENVCLHGLVPWNNNYASITRHTRTQSAYQILSAAARKMRALVDKVSGAQKNCLRVSFSQARERERRRQGSVRSAASIIHISYIHCWFERREREASNAGADCLCARRFCKLIFSSITSQRDGRFRHSFTSSDFLPLALRNCSFGDKMTFCRYWMSHIEIVKFYIIKEQC